MFDDFLLNKNFRVKEKTLCLPDKVEIKIFDFEPNSPDPEKPIIVFVAGWISLINGWKNVLSALAPKYRILDRKSTRLNSSHLCASRMPSSA